MTRSPSLGYIPSVFPCGPPADAQIQNAHQAQNLPANANPATSVEQSDTSTPALVPSLTSSTLPSVPSLDLLSVLNDPAAADALTVDPSQPNYVHLCQLFQEATAFNPALSDSQAYPYAHPGPSEYQYQVPVSIPTSYEALLTTVLHTSSQKPHTNINVTNHSSDTIHNRSRTVSGSTSHPFNMSFAPSLQSHSTSVHPAASLGPGASDKSTSVPAFSLAALHGYSQNVWNAQRLQALAFGTKRIHATDPPGAAASTVEGDTSTSTSAYCHGETSVSSDTNLSPSLNEESYFTINTSGMSESQLVSQGGEEEEEESDSGE
ncbi:hypothetical protein EUX98_g5865 [Antrodiella citrinella]|uniref:Uncharacterized protein n=1 Tax=Antrodiella citrinella TaxID=2447956 RepID=A0A4S4MY53_9APHY|nr:hypothetical protein EUX98_g5865 [Antrodiella citrinella]